MKTGNSPTNFRGGQVIAGVDFHFIGKKRMKLSLPFQSLFKFVVKEADIACDPVLSSPLPNEEDNGRIRNERNKPKRQWLPQRKSHDASTFKTTTTDENKGTDDKKQTPKVIVKSCIFCKTDHDPDACPEFMKRTISERKEFASIRGLCFGCLQRGHLSKDCKERKKCTVCN